MQMLGNQQAADMESVVSNLFRVGTVDVINESACTARVVFEDRDNMQSYDLRVIVKNTIKNKDYWMPDIGEQVLCLFLPTGLESGFIIGSYYTDDTARPASTGDKRVTVFDDGTKIEYDRSSGTLIADLGGSKIEATKDHILLQVGGNGIEITESGLSMIGAVSQTGGDITSNGVSLQHHTHGGVQSGGSNTTEPN